MFGLTEGKQPLNVGDRVLVAGQRRGYVRYSGQTKFAPGTVKPRLVESPSYVTPNVMTGDHTSIQMC